MIGSIGFPELILIFIVALLVFGPKKLPEIARNLAKTFYTVKKEIAKAQLTIQEELKDIEELNEIKDIKVEEIDIDIEEEDLKKESDEKQEKPQ